MPNWKDLWDRHAKGPLIVPIDRVELDRTRVNERDVRHYVNTPTQTWYFEPITCIKMGDKYHAAGTYANSMIEACRRLGYKDLQICWVEPSKLRIE